jgi:hypothetical protein
MFAEAKQSNFFKRLMRATDFVLAPIAYVIPKDLVLSPCAEYLPETNSSLEDPTNACIQVKSDSTLMSQIVSRLTRSSLSTQRPIYVTVS